MQKWKQRLEVRMESRKPAPDNSTRLWRSSAVHAFPADCHSLKVVTLKWMRKSTSRVFRVIFRCLHVPFKFSVKYTNCFLSFSPLKNGLTKQAVIGENRAFACSVITKTIKTKLSFFRLLCRRREGTAYESTAVCQECSKVCAGAQHSLLSRWCAPETRVKRMSPACCRERSRVFYISKTLINLTELARICHHLCV